MAEQYTPGLQRIFYKSTGLKEGLFIKVTLFDSALNNIAIYELIEAKNIKGLYYFEHDFYEGVYVAYFHENELEKAVQVYNIKDNIRGGSRPFRGDNVING